MIKNRDIGASVAGLQFSRHDKAHFCRAVQEGIAFSLNYGIGIMREIGVNLTRVRAGRSNMFLSKVFRETLAGVMKTPIELYNTDGAQGAARGAGIGAKIYSDAQSAFSGLVLEETVEPAAATMDAYASAYGRWLRELEKKLASI
jgi:xylulokinase